MLKIEHKQIKLCSSKDEKLQRMFSNFRASFSRMAWVVVATPGFA